MAYHSDIRLSRQKQINTLRVFNDNVTERIPGKEYSVSFSSSGLALNLILKLKENFPVEKPIVEISPVVQHPWIDPTGRIDSPGLRSFSQHSDLGMVVSALRSELEKSSLQLVKRPDNPAIPRYTKETPNVSFEADFVRNKLSQLSMDDMKSILEDEDHMEKILAELEAENGALDSLLTTAEKTRESVCEKALQNQELQRKVESSRSSLISKYEEYHQKKQQLQKSLDSLKKLNDRVDPSLLAERLLTISASCDEESEEIAENFLQKRLHVGEFVPRYVKSRGDGCIKKIKAEKLVKSKHNN